MCIEYNGDVIEEQIINRENANYLLNWHSRELHLKYAAFLHSLVIMYSLSTLWFDHVYSK